MQGLHVRPYSVWDSSVKRDVKTPRMTWDRERDRTTIVDLGTVPKGLNCLTKQQVYLRAGARGGSSMGDGAMLSVV